MFDILLFLFESYFDLGSYPDHDKLSLKLTAAGFEEEDINQALLWLSGLQQLTQAKYPDSINHSGFRLYSDYEQKRISSEALQFLRFWEHNKFISPIEREMIIDRAVALDREGLQLDKVKLIMLMVLWSQHEELDPMLIEDLLTPSGTTPLH
ncbi:Smg family protein [Sideroxyarcus sp. TK5]|jgi:Smg protein